MFFVVLTLAFRKKCFNVETLKTAACDSSADVVLADEERIDMLYESSAGYDVRVDDNYTVVTVNVINLFLEKHNKKGCYEAKCRDCEIIKTVGKKCGYAPLFKVLVEGPGVVIGYYSHIYTSIFDWIFYVIIAVVILIVAIVVLIIWCKSKRGRCCKKDENDSYDEKESF